MRGEDRKEEEKRRGRRGERGGLTNSSTAVLVITAISGAVAEEKTASPDALQRSLTTCINKDTSRETGRAERQTERRDRQSRETGRAEQTAQGQRVELRDGWTDREMTDREMTDSSFWPAWHIRWRNGQRGDE